MPADLLFEIGCEEIPAKMLARALAELPAHGRRAARRRARSRTASVRALGTPRRLAVIVKRPRGSPARSRRGGRRAAGVGGVRARRHADEGRPGLRREERRRRRRRSRRRRSPARRACTWSRRAHVVGSDDARAVARRCSRELAVGIAWPKSMRWGWSETAFVRPVQWLVALLGGEVVPLSWAGQTAGRADPRPSLPRAPAAIEIAVRRPLRRGAARGARRRRSRSRARPRSRASCARLEKRDRLARAPGRRAARRGRSNLGEYPVGVVRPVRSRVPRGARGDHRHRDAHAPALLRDGGRARQARAAVRDASTATIVKDPSRRRAGQRERARVAPGRREVLLRRGSQEASFDAWNQKLDGVVFQAKLGDGAKTIGDKVRRIVELVKRAADGTTRPTPRRAALQGGSRVARGRRVPRAPGRDGPPLRRALRRAARASPTRSSSTGGRRGRAQSCRRPTPRAIVAIADRIDTLVGCFAVGLEPTGSADPLRPAPRGDRHAGRSCSRMTERQRTLTYWIDTAARGARRQR